MTLDEALIMVLDDLARQARDLGRQGKPMLLSYPMMAINHLEIVYPEKVRHWLGVADMRVTRAD
jgi:hypothetical protein